MSRALEPSTRSRSWARISQIIEAITEEGPLTYKELLPKMPGVTTEEHVGSIVATGKAWGVLQNLTGDGDLPEGRAKDTESATRFVEIVRQAGCVIGLNVGRTYFAIGVADPNGRLLSTYGEPPPKGLRGKAKEEAWREYRDGQMIVHDRGAGLGGRPLLKHVAKRTIEWLEQVKVKNEEIRGITLSLPVSVSATKSETLTSSIEPTLTELNIKRQLIAALGKDRYPNLKKVVVANDADMAARGEVRYGKARGMRDVVAIHAAFGVGAGVITDGSVLHTGSGGGAGEIGHCVPRLMDDEGAGYGLPRLSYDSDLFTCKCGCPGHLEALAGGEAIVKRIAEAGGKAKPKPPKRLARALGNPDKTIAEKLDEVLKASTGKRPWKPGQAALRDAARLLGGAVHTVAHLFNPEAVFLSGKLSEAGEPFLDEVKDAFEQLGSLGGYSPEIKLGTASGAFRRRLIMVRGAAMTGVRSTPPLIEVEHLKELEKRHRAKRERKRSEKGSRKKSRRPRGADS